MKAGEYQYACKVITDQKMVGIDTNNVFVGYPPAIVSNFTCRSPNWESLNCSFKAPYNPVKVEYNLTFQLDGLMSNCSLTKDNTCILTEITDSIFRKTYNDYFFTLESTNLLGNRIETFDVKLFSIVIPNKPIKFIYENVTDKSATLNWTRPNLLVPFKKRKTISRFHHKLMTHFVFNFVYFPFLK